MNRDDNPSPTGGVVVDKAPFGLHKVNWRSHPSLASSSLEFAIAMVEHQRNVRSRKDMFPYTRRKFKKSDCVGELMANELHCEGVKETKNTLPLFCSPTGVVNHWPE